MYAILAFATLTEVSTLAHRIWLIIFILLRLDIISGLRGIVYQFLGKQKSCLFRNNSSIIAYYFYFVKPISASHLRQYCTDCLDYSTPSCILSRVFSIFFFSYDNCMRNQEWLENRFEYIYRKYFADLEAPNQIEIKWGRRSRRQLGCIKKEQSSAGWQIADHFKSDFTTIIVINGLFEDEKIPLFIVDAVIAHELSHYAHGFNSPLPQKHRHPHKGGVIRKELKKRDLAALEKRQKQWMKKNWQKYLQNNFPISPRRYRQRRIRIIFR